jgi:transcriptional regulator with AAA-type ATPase domain
MRSVDHAHTITRTGARKGKGEAGKPFLFLVFQCDRPQMPGARFCLAGADEVTIGRASALTVGRIDRALRIGLPDGRMSAQHVRLQLVLGTWVAEDLRSKNGTLLDGRRIAREQLADQALLELGHTFLLFRETLPLPGGPATLDGRGLQSAEPGLATLLPALASELERLETVARSRIPVLLRGESGTGKELLAAAIHRLSGRPGAFQAVNCGAIAATLVESELFGHRRGAFSGAVDDHLGVIRGADRGTLLLDEIGDLTLPAQAALLRVLQEEEVLPVGATRPLKVDLRVVAATNHDLDALVAQNRFRADLLGRISGYACTLPPLRERREDFALLVAALLEKVSAPHHLGFSPDAARALLRHPWPLNIRELEQCLSSAAVLSRDERVELEDLPECLGAPPAPRPPDEQELKRRDELLGLLREHEGNVTSVARAMGKARTQVQRWLRRYAIDPLSFHR